jgi:hypothetical protein
MASYDMAAPTSRLSTLFHKYDDVFLADSCRHGKVIPSQEDRSCPGGALS